MKKILRELQFAYYTVYIAALTAALLGYYVLYNGVQIDPKSQLGISLSSALIIFIVGSVPVALGLFHRYTKKLQTEPDTTIKFAKYKKAALIRIAIIGLSLVAGVIFYYVLRSQSMIFCAGIAAIGLVFCKPAEIKIITDLQLEEPED